ncbi:hypothetical protein ACW9HH_14825 [Nocardia gipuzkoensis]
MGYTYVSQYDTGSLYKLGKATTLSQRQSSLRTGSSGKLELFDYVETEHALEGEGSSNVCGPRGRISTAKRSTD